MVWYESMANVALSWIILIITLVIVGVIVFLIAKKVLKELQYKYKCIIFEEGNDSAIVDKAGVFIDKKTQNKRFFLKKANVGLNPDKIPYKTAVAGFGVTKYVFLLKTGLKNFRYLNLKSSSNPGFYVSVGEEDVNWAINAYERQKKLFSQTLLMQLMPFIALAFTSIIILIIFIYFFKEFGTLRDMAVAMQEAAKELAKASIGAVVS